MAKPRKHMVLPDTQVKPGVNIDHIGWVSRYAIEKKPDVIVVIGDWADMHSLSSYDKGKKSFEGRTYKEDIAAANEALRILMEPIKAEVKRLEEKHKRRWNPRLIVTLGNHEERINRAIEHQRELDNLISTDQIEFAKYGFEVYPYLKPAIVDGVAYCHFFTSGVKGHPCTTAAQLIQKHHMSCVAGHQQGKDIAFAKRPDGSRITSIIAGSFYSHEERYLNPQGNEHWRGFFMLHEVNNGSFDEMPVSLDFLRRRYAKEEAHKSRVDSEVPLPLPHGA